MVPVLHRFGHVVLHYSGRVRLLSQGIGEHERLVEAHLRGQGRAATVTVRSVIVILSILLPQVPLLIIAIVIIIVSITKQHCKNHYEHHYEHHYENPCYCNEQGPHIPPPSIARSPDAPPPSPRRSQR